MADETPDVKVEQDLAALAADVAALAPEGGADPPADAPPVPDSAAPADAALPVCPACGAGLRIERRTPDFATRYTQICDRCGYHETLNG